MANPGSRTNPKRPRTNPIPRVKSQQKVKGLMRELTGLGFNLLRTSWQRKPRSNRIETSSSINLRGSGNHVSTAYFTEILFHLLIFVAAETTYQPHITEILFYLLIFVAAETTYQPHRNFIDSSI